MRKSKKYKRKRRYLFLIVILGITLTTSTYAWFTVNRVISVESLNVKVEAEGGLEISVDGTNWKTSVSSTEIKEANSTYPTSKNQLPSKFKPVSTVGEIDGTTGHMNMYLGTVENDSTGYYTLTSSKETDVDSIEEGNYITFDLFLKTPSPSTIYLTDASGVTYVGEKSHGIENAIRYAFIDEGTTELGSSLTTIQGLKNATNNSVFIWEPNYDVHTTYGVSNAKNTYGITTTTENANALSYDGIKNEIKLVDRVYIQNALKTKHPTLFDTVNVDLYTKTSFEDYKSIMDLQAGITKIRVYIWLEGQDVDCENNAAAGNIEFKFQFSLNPA